MKKLIKRTGIFVLIASMLFLAGCSSSGGSKTIRIVHKNFTEQRIMGEMLSVYLESKGYETTVNELGGSMLCFNALNNGEADLYPEYTGTGYSCILEQSDILSPNETYDYVKSHFEEDYGITWLAPFGFNNTYVLSVTEETAEKYDITSISDLKDLAGDMILGCDQEFVVRTDGYPGMCTLYGFEFKKVKNMDQGLTYAALAEGDLDVNVSFSTDGRIAKYNLVNLEDDKHFFPPYYCTPILKQEFAEANPGVVTALEALENAWSDTDMQKYNLQVDEGAELRDVATQMLKDKGLID
ncbi:MAG: glycine betaine ABC transporter substrate-binding protein [Caldisericota bacterium]|nr:glycine betaine ABC transporter substrate-binding protein [Caldisericota bacterium]